MSDRIIIYAIRWRYKPYVRLVWSTKDLITTRAGKVNRLRSILNYFNVVNFTAKTENPQLQEFINQNWTSLKDTTIDDVEFLELESLDLKTLTAKDIKRELNYHSVMFTIDGYTVLNFNRYKVRLPKKEGK